MLIIVGDDIGYGHMGAFGGPARTPTFDRLAEQGLKYTNYHVTAVCSASRACLADRAQLPFRRHGRDPGELDRVPGLQRA